MYCRITAYNDKNTHETSKYQWRFFYCANSRSAGSEHKNKGNTQKKEKTEQQREQRTTKTIN